MKKYILVLTILAIAQTSGAQPNQLISDWLYNLPVGKRPAALWGAIQKNDNFIEKKRGYINSDIPYSELTYSGRVVRAALPDNLLPDSSKINFNVGSLTALKGYSGYIKILRFEYFFKDSVLINELFDAAFRELSKDSVPQKGTGAINNHNHSTGKGTQFIYRDENKGMSRISIEKVEYFSGEFSFLIIFSGSMD